MMNTRFDVAVVGGGPAGSTAAMFLARKNFSVCIIEKTTFPRETMCGEFLSREVVQILQELDLHELFYALHPNRLTSVRFCPGGRQSYTAPLLFPAHGMKRGRFDAFLLEGARRSGAVIRQPEIVEAIRRTDSGYALQIRTPNGPETIQAGYVVDAHGKGASWEGRKQRATARHRSRLNGVKFHVPRKYFPAIPDGEIQLYTGRRMYCGVNVVDGETVTVCFLEDRSRNDDPPRAKMRALMKTNREFALSVSGDFETALSSFPVYGSGDIHFGKSSLVRDGVFAAGDAASVIAPLAGDGIGRAMESARIVAEVLEEGRMAGMGDDAVERMYAARWTTAFQRRLWFAGGIQRLLLSKFGSGVSGYVLKRFPSLLSRAVQTTRG